MPESLKNTVDPAQYCLVAEEKLNQSWIQSKLFRSKGQPHEKRSKKSGNDFFLTIERMIIKEVSFLWYIMLRSCSLTKKVRPSRLTQNPIRPPASPWNRSGPDHKVWIARMCVLIAFQVWYKLNVFFSSVFEIRTYRQGYTTKSPRIKFFKVEVTC